MIGGLCVLKGLFYGGVFGLVFDMFDVIGYLENVKIWLIDVVV